ncbi:hypothetical protein ABI59_22455 [Acidobacteria bacterium Mor1]|nr:hypothetical protein ABI59_22455 [Acidobacteria bacterium Mor1]
MKRGRETGNRRRALWAGLFLVAMSAVPASAGTMDAFWSPEGDVTVDGSADEWLGRMAYIKKAGLYFGVRNDADHLYLCFYSANPQMSRRAIVRGMKISIGKRLQLQYPEGILDKLPGAEGQAGQAGQGAPGQGGPAQPPDPEEMQKRAAESLEMMQVVIPARDEPLRIARDNLFGIQIELDTEREFTYELKIPLRPTEEAPYAASLSPGDKLTIRVEQPQVLLPLEGGPGGLGDGGFAGGRGGGAGTGLGRGRGGGGIGPAGGVRPGGGTRPGFGRGPAGMPNPIEFKQKVQLAKAP